jgi:hypothetical protein
VYLFAGILCGGQLSLYLETFLVTPCVTHSTPGARLSVSAEQWPVNWRVLSVGSGLVCPPLDNVNEQMMDS